MFAQSHAVQPDAVPQAEQFQFNSRAYENDWKLQGWGKSCKLRCLRYL